MVKKLLILLMYFTLGIVTSTAIVAQTNLAADGTRVQWAHTIQVSGSGMQYDLPQPIHIIAPAGMSISIRNTIPNLGGSPFIYDTGLNEITDLHAYLAGIGDMNGRGYAGIFYMTSTGHVWDYWTNVYTVNAYSICKDITVPLDGNGNATIAATDVYGGNNPNIGVVSYSIDKNTFDCSSIAGVTLPPVVAVQQLSINAGAGGPTQWQSFTAPFTGHINSIDVRHGFPNTSQNTIINLELYEGEGTANLIATATNTNQGISGSQAFYNYQFNAVPIISGQKYTWRIYFTTAQNIGWLNLDISNPYAGGRGSNDINWDYVFKVNASEIIPNQVTLTVTDPAGNTDTCTASVTVVDTLAPTLTAVSDQNENVDAMCSFTIPDYTGLTTAADNCGTEMVTQSPLAGTVISGNGTVQAITLSVNDVNGNTNSTSFNVTLVDAIAPTVLTQDITVQLDANGNATITPAQINNGSTDNCTSPIDLVLSLDKTSFNCADVGNTSGIIRAADNNGNYYDLNITTGEATIIGTINGGCNSGVNAIAYDPISGRAFAQSPNGCYEFFEFNPETGGMINSFNTNDVPAALEFVNGVLYGSGIISGELLVINMDTAEMTPIGSHDGNGLWMNGFAYNTNTGTMYGVRGGGGLTELYTINLSTGEATIVGSCGVSLGSINFDSNGKLYGGGGQMPARGNIYEINLLTGEATLVGPTGIPGPVVVNAMMTYDSLSNASSGVTVTLTVTDENGNSNTATAIITVEDNILPTVLTQDITVQLDEEGLATITPAQIDNSSTDNCSIATYSLDITNFSCEDTGDNTVTLTVTDVNGNSNTATAIVTVEDNSAPTIICAENISINNDLGVCGANVTVPQPIVSDNCSISGSTSLAFDGSNDYVNGPNDVVPVTGEYTISVWAKEANDHPSEFRNIFAQGRSLYLGYSNTGIIRLGDSWEDTGVAFPTDNQWHHYTVVRKTNDTELYIDGILIASKGSAIPSPGVNGTWPHNFVVGSQWDGGSEVFDGQIDEIQIWNTSLTEAQITSNMSQRLLGTEANLVAYYNFEDGTGSAILTDVVSSNNGTLTNMDVNAAWVASPYPISAINLTNNFTNNFSASTIYPVGETTVIWTATDASGNVATCLQTVTVNDTEAPTVLTQSITVQLNADGLATITPAQIDNVSTDNCEIDSYALDVYTFDCSNVGENTVTLTVTDIYGNSDSSTAIVTVEDNVAPNVVTVAPFTLQLDEEGSTITITAEDIENGSTDACGIESYALDVDTFDCSNVGENTVTLLVTDIHGNVGTATTVVTIEDTVAPVVITQNVTVELNSRGEAFIDVNDINNGSFDNCSIATMSLDRTAFECS
uniref:LamG-like jellyroll fold domain-containing protein n=1 Tax=Lutibacter sp. TaxID=1925666 RepID=UPI0035651F6F